MQIAGIPEVTGDEILPDLVAEVGCCSSRSMTAGVAFLFGVLSRSTKELAGTVAQELKEVVAEQALELRLLKKCMIAGRRGMRVPGSEKLESKRPNNVSSTSNCGQASRPSPGFHGLISNSAQLSAAAVSLNFRFSQGPRLHRRMTLVARICASGVENSASVSIREAQLLIGEQE